MNPHFAEIVAEAGLKEGTGGLGEGLAPASPGFDRRFSRWRCFLRVVGIDLCLKILFFVVLLVFFLPLNDRTINELCLDLFFFLVLLRPCCLPLDERGNLL